MKYETNRPITLLEALTLMAPDSSKTTLRTWLKAGRVSVDGTVEKVGSTILTAGQQITLGVKEKIMEEGIKVLYEDSHIIAIEKPEGMLSVSTEFEKGHTAHAILKNKFRPKKVYVVHRLDQDTSGVMIFALNEKTKEMLKKIFEKHDIERHYIAIIEGALEQPKGTWECYLAEDANYRVFKTNNPDKGQRAITHYEVVATNKKYSKLDVTLETGRKNQIRVHCQLSGHPVVGDNKYDSAVDPLRRLCLHARYLSFIHPITGKKIVLESPEPERFKKLI